ncbi:MAG: sugar ABC transporter permease [Lachnospiraceae bacterium]|nr:sugar ABC transporter permease [Lachnospiraceae bacterium]
MRKKKSVEHGKYGVLFAVPFFVVFLVFQLYPLIYTFYNSLIYSAKNGRNITESFGFGNFKNYVFGNLGGGEIWKALGVTVVLWILNFIPQILLSLLLAAWFTDIKYKLKGNGIYKVIMYMPNIITAATIAVLFYSMFETNGPITSLVRKWGWVGKDGFLKTGWASLIIIAFIQFWMWYGNTMIVLCAGIMGINPSLYEAAMVDGASSRQQFFQITLPLLKPILQYTLVTSAIGGLQMYDIPALFNDGGPVVLFNGQAVNSTTTVMMLIKNYTSVSPAQNLGRAASYSIVLFIVTMIISLVFYKLTQDKTNDGR